MSQKRHQHRWSRVEHRVDFFGQLLTVDAWERCSCGATRDVGWAW